MTTMQQPVDSAAPGAIQKEAASAVWGRNLKRFAIGLLILSVLFALTYAYGWYNAYQLSTRFLRDANQSYEEGDYLNALTGREVYNEEEEQYQEIGGYLNVERIWSHRFSWPTPDLVAQARQRSEEIIQQRLTVAQAEQYVQANIGKQAPYLAEIYFRLGELYLEQGDEVAARDIFESIPEFFSGSEDLIQQAEQHLDQLDTSE